MRVVRVTARARQRAIALGLCALVPFAAQGAGGEANAATAKKAAPKRVPAPAPAVAKLTGARKAATDVAKRALNATRSPAGSILYGTPSPLPAGTVVREAGPTGAISVTREGQLVASRRTWTLSRPTWMFWLDLMPGRNFAHPSKIAFVGADDRRVLAQANLGFYPVVNGSTSPFVTRPGDRNLRVFANGPGDLDAAVAARGGAAPAVRPILPVASLAKDCMVVLYDEFDDRPSNFFDNAQALVGWADRVGLRYRLTPTPARLRESIADLAKAGCDDVVISLNGHGLPATQTLFMLIDGELVPYEAPFPSAPEATVMFGIAAPGDPLVKESDWAFRSSDLRTIVGEFPNVTFKLLVEACFSGRFAADLKDLTEGDKPRILFIGTSAAADQPSIQSIVGESDIASFWVRSYVGKLTGWVGTLQTQNIAEGVRLAPLLRQAAELQRVFPEIRTKEGELYDQSNLPSFGPSVSSNTAASAPAPAPVPSTAAAAPPTAAPQPFTAVLTNSGACVTGPGMSRIDGSIATEPRQPGATATIETTGPGVVSGAMQQIGLVDGTGRYSAEINRLGEYTSRVEVRAPSGVTSRQEMRIGVAAGHPSCP